MYQVPKLPNEYYIIAGKRVKVVQAYLDHEMYDKNGDLGHDMVEELMMSVYKIFPNN